MRTKRSKQYRKLMQQYGLNFGFREPYQVLVDADMIKDAERFKMDLVGGLERTLHGKIKPMITQCCIRHLYASKSEPGISKIIEKAKLFERRRCDHLPEEYPEPLSAIECISSVVDPKSSKTNKHRYVIASQDLSVRNSMREIMGVPLIYISRSVMILEPMAEATVQSREREEKEKFRAGIKSRTTSAGQGLKRKREDADSDAQGGQLNGAEGSSKQKKAYGTKGPNPLSIKKPKKRNDEGDVKPSSHANSIAQSIQGPDSPEGNEAPGTKVKRKRKRKHKFDVDGGTGDGLVTREDSPRTIGGNDLLIQDDNS